jgi:hypothetical protein
VDTKTRYSREDFEREIEALEPSMTGINDDLNSKESQKEDFEYQIEDLDDEIRELEEERDTYYRDVILKILKRNTIKCRLEKYPLVFMFKDKTIFDSHLLSYLCDTMSTIRDIYINGIVIEFSQGYGWEHEKGDPYLMRIYAEGTKLGEIVNEIFGKVVFEESEEIITKLCYNSRLLENFVNAVRSK